MLVILTMLLLCNIVLAYEGESLHHYEIDNADEYFQWFVKSHQKNYNECEEKSRLEIFKENLKKINEKNAAEKSAVFGINKFSDLTDEEFIQYYTGLLSANGTMNFGRCQEPSVRSSFKDLPTNYDWRDKNIVSSVKDQGVCGSCWAYSTAGTVEGAYAKKYSRLIDLSPQQLVDCDNSNNGCDGGFPWDALSYIIPNGLESENDYPYKGVAGSCAYNSGKAVAKLSGCVAGTVTEETLKQLLYENGPLSIGLDAKDIKPYTSGILQNCGCERINHAVLLVGYGEENGVPYWTIKNSWGTGWGIGGYIKIHRGSNACGIINEAISYGIIA